MIHQLGSALIVLAALEALACVVFYGGWFRWWTSPEGWHLIRFMAVFAGALTLWAVLLLTGGTAWTPVDAGAREWARLVTFVPIAYVLADRLRLMIKAKHGERTERRNGMSDPSPAQKPEAELVVEGVDLREWGPTEGDEEAVLRELYGEPDEHGIYRGGDEETP